VRLGDAAQSASDHRDLLPFDVLAEVARALGPLHQLIAERFEADRASRGLHHLRPGAHHLAESAIVGLNLGRKADEVAEAIPGILSLEALAGLLREAHEALGRESGDQIVLGGEVAIDGPHAHLRGLGDVRHLRVEALVREQLLGRGDHRLVVPPGIGAHRLRGTVLR
jgi:hypothetical protein